MKEHYIIDEESLQHLPSLFRDKKPTTVTKNKIIFTDMILDIPDRLRDNVMDLLTTDIERIMYGKNPTTHIVNISVKNDTLYIYREIDGVLYCDEEPYKYWLVSPKYAVGCERLKGEQHYLWLKEYNESGFLSVQPNIYKYGLWTVKQLGEQAMLRHGYTYFKNMKPKDVSILSFDIETNGLVADNSSIVFLITNTFRKNDNYIKKTFNIDDYSTNQDMIVDWVKWVNDINPSIITGYNILSFDIPFLVKVMALHNKTINLGRDSSPIEIEQRVREKRKDGSQTISYNRINCFGREIIDMFFVAIDYDAVPRRYESFKLKSIIKTEGLEKQDRTFIDASKISEMWNDFSLKNKVIQYAEEDSEDPIKLFDLMIPSKFYFNQYCPKPFQIMCESATGSQLNAIMVRSYIQDNFALAAPDSIVDYEGAISMGNPGIYRNCLKFDVASLYPSIMVAYKIENPKKDFNHNFQKIVKYLRTERLNNKKLAKETGSRYYNEMQEMMKITINSLYGALSTKGMNYNYPEGAAEITRQGREILKLAIKWATSNDYKEVLSEDV